MKNSTVVLLVLAAALSRWMPHVPNITPVTALALLGGAYVSNRALAVALPVLAMILSDLYLGFHSTVGFVYGAVAFIALCSSRISKNQGNWRQWGLASLASSLLFFVVTNFGVWLMDSLYEKTALGLAQCYLMAIPFLGTQIIGDLFYTGLLFASIELMRLHRPQWVSGSSGLFR